MKKPISNWLDLYGTHFNSRLLLGTAKYPSMDILLDAIKVAQPAMVTMALRRETAATQASHGLFDTLKQTDITILPNTAGCRSADEAITTALCACDLYQTDWIKLEVIGCDNTLQPDPFQLITAAETLIKKNLKVLPYCTEDLIVARRLIDVGCRVLMPWAAPIGTGQGVVNEYGMRKLREYFPEIPLIVDAGLGLPSHACQVMEWGYDGVLLNTAVSQANDPIKMAQAFSQAVQAGHNAYRAGPCAKSDIAKPSTPTVGMPIWHYDK